MFKNDTGCSFFLFYFGKNFSKNVQMYVWWKCFTSILLTSHSQFFQLLTKVLDFAFFSSGSILGGIIGTLSYIYNHGEVSCSGGHLTCSLLHDCGTSQNCNNSVNKYLIIFFLFETQRSHYIKIEKPYAQCFQSN